jgi:hypothetical protein
MRWKASPLVRQADRVTITGRTITPGGNAFFFEAHAVSVFFTGAFLGGAGAASHKFRGISFPLRSFELTRLCHVTSAN